MKNEEEIRKRIIKLETIKELYEEGELPYRIWQFKQFEYEALKWVLDEIDGKSPELDKPIQISNNTLVDKAYQYLKEHGQCTMNELFPTMNKSSLAHYKTKLMQEYPNVKLIGGVGKRNKPYVYAMIEDKIKTSKDIQEYDDLDIVLDESKLNDNKEVK